MRNALRRKGIFGCLGSVRLFNDVHAIAQQADDRERTR